jgi:hypothetical protein
MNPVGHGLIGVPDAGAFLARLTRIDPAALVRLRPVADPADGLPRTALWARLPWQVLVTRAVHGTGPNEATVAAADLLAVLADGGDRLPPRRDAQWRWPLPPGPGEVVETVGGEELATIAEAAAGTLRTATTARRVGERVIRDALLDHVAIVVTPPADASVGGVEVPQRLVQAVVRMGFLGPSARSAVQVRIARRWVGLAAPYGTAWLQTVNSLLIRTSTVHTNG